MDWSKTKTIFILIFLILDLFLIFQILEKRTTGQLEYITESTIEEQLEADDITFVELPKEDEDASYITAQRKKFISPDLIKLKQQDVSFLTEEWIVSKFTEPVSLPTMNIEEYLNEFIANNVIEGEAYQYWGWNKKTNKLIFFQTYRKRPLYYNENAMLSIQLNEENQIVSYEQTMLTNIKEIKEEGSTKEILPSIKAIENLYSNDYLSSGSHISKAELGYYKNVPISGDVQIFVPTWHIVVDHEMNYFVNAIDGQVMELIQTGVGENDFAF